MKYQTTRKAVMASNRSVINIGNLGAYYLLGNTHPAAYTCGVYGWNANIYEIDYNTVIVMGDRPFGNISPDCDFILAYNEKAKQAETHEEVDALLAEFVEKCKEMKQKEELRKIRKKLKLENLTATYYENDSNTMTLEFRPDGGLVWVRNVKEFDADDEFYWDDAKNVRRALKNAADDDVEIVY